MYIKVVEEVGFGFFWFRNKIERQRNTRQDRNKDSITSKILILGEIWNHIWLIWIWDLIFSSFVVPFEERLRIITRNNWRKKCILIFLLVCSVIFKQSINYKKDSSRVSFHSKPNKPTNRTISFYHCAKHSPRKNPQNAHLRKESSALESEST